MYPKILIMKIKILLNILLACLLANFLSCESIIHEDKEELKKHIEEQDVYLSISRAATADTKTINEDTENYEDRVHDLALLIFDSSTGEKICEYFDSGIPVSDNEKTFTVKLTTGQRDFYFVANMPVTTLKTIKNRSEMITYMSTFRDLDMSIYKGATENKGFPMSRVYLNQIITEGGNIYSPKNFQPVTNGKKEDGVRLIRAVAKFEVVLDGVINDLGIKAVYYRNAYRQFALTPDTYPPTITYLEDSLLKKVGNSYICYMPEAMMMNTSPKWSTTSYKPINFFLIETANGTFYKIPIITYNQTMFEYDYLSFATGQLAEKPDYNIYRNRHYYYNVNNLQTIEILYTIEPWNINKNTTFMGYGYNVCIDQNGKISVNNTINSCAPHSIKMKTILPFCFKDTSREKVFESLNIDAYAEYMLDSVPQKGDYLELYYNGTKVKTFSK